MGLSFTISVFNSHRQPIKKHVWACNARFLDLVTWFQTIHFTTQLPQATYQKACLGLQCQIPRSGHLVLFGQQASIVRVTRCALKRINTKSQYICLVLFWQPIKKTLTLNPIAKTQTLNPIKLKENWKVFFFFLKKKRKKTLNVCVFLENHEFCNFQLQTWFPKTIVVAMRNSNMLLQTKQKVI